MSRIIILTGMVRSGKTTALQQWIDRKESIYGILTPDIDGERTFLHYPDRLKYKMICKPDTPDALQIGRFQFSKSSFQKVNQLLIADFENSACKWLVIDEIGPLELNGKGLATSVDHILENKDKKSINIVLIVREKLVEQVIAHYKLFDHQVLDKKELRNL